MATTTLENDRMLVSLCPAFGARVTTLRDKRTGRDWIGAGPCVGSAADDAEFGREAATGWDECFPTVTPCLSRDGRRLRDHGDLWGRPWDVTAASATSVTTLRLSAQFGFERTLTLAGSAVLCQYQVENRSDDPMDYLWAMHALFALTAGDRIELPTGTPCQVTFCTDRKTQGRIAWPAGAAFPLDQVQPIDRGFAAKLLVDDGPDVGVRIGDVASSLLITAAKQLAGSTGIWLCYGGWPGANGVHQVAIEPTSAPADDLAAARAMGRAITIQPGRSAQWWTRLTLGAGLPALEPKTIAAYGAC